MDPVTINLIISAGGIVGTGVAAYAAFKAALAVHEQRLDAVEDEVKELRKWRHHIADSLIALQSEMLRRGYEIPSIRRAPPDQKR